MLSKKNAKANQEINSNFLIINFYKLLQMMPNRIGPLFWLSLSSIFSNFCSLAIPIFFMQVYDRIMIHQSIDTLIWLSIGIIIVIFIDSLVSVIKGRLASLYSTQFAAYQEHSLMEEIFTLSSRDYENTGAAEMDDKFRDIGKLQSFLSGNFFQVLIDIPFAFLFLMASFYFGGKLAYFHLTVMTIYILFQIFFSSLINKKNTRVQKNMVKRLSFLREILEKIHFIKAQALEEPMLRKLEDLQEDLTYSDNNLYGFQHFSRFFGNLISQIMIYGTIIIGGYLIIKGSLTVGTVTAVTMISRRMISPLQSFNQFSIKMAAAGNQLKNISLKKKGMPVNFEKMDFKYNIDGNFEIRNLSYTSQFEEAGDLNNLNLVAQKGKITAINVCDNSAADSLAQLLYGTVKPDQGMIIADNYILSNHKSLYLSQTYTILPRQNKLLKGTILENITSFEPGLGLQAYDTAAFLGLEDEISAFPKGYETEMGNYSNQIISSGFIQKISLARALLTRPRILISDRSDETMDTETLQDFASILEKIKSTTCILLISSNSRLCERADSLYDLKNSTLTKQQSGEAPK